MPNSREKSSPNAWASNPNVFMSAQRGAEQPAAADSFMQPSELYGVGDRFPSRTTLSENYTVLPVGHGNFLKVYHSNDNEPTAFNSYELFSSNSIIPPDTMLTSPASFESPPQFQTNETTSMIINQLVTNWSPNLTGTYSPFGEHVVPNNIPPHAEKPGKPNVAPQPINKTVGGSNFKSSVKTNGSFENNSTIIPEVKKRIVAEVKPMRMSYSDVLSKNVAYNAQNSSQTNQNQNYSSMELNNQARNSKVTNEKGKTSPQIGDRKVVDDRDKNDFKVKKEYQPSVKSGDNFSTNSVPIQKDKRRSAPEDKDSSFSSQVKPAKKSLDPSKNKSKNSQTNGTSSKRKPNKREGGTPETKSTSKGNEKEFFYNIAKNESTNEKNQKPFQHGNLRKRQVPAGPRNSSRTEKIAYSKRSQKQQKDMKYDLIVKLLEKWYEYTSKIVVWLFYLIYDIIVLGFSMMLERLQAFYVALCIFLVNFRKEFKNNSGKPSIWLRDILKKVDNKFKKNSKFAFWRNFYKKKQQEPVADFYKNGRLPQTGEEAMYSLLNCKGKDAYSILGVSPDSTQEQIRKHYKKIAVLVHPDKNKQPGAEEAFKVLQRAFELIGEPENRKSYDQSLAEALNAEKAWTELHDLLSQLQSKIAEAANTIRCSSCGLRHPRKLTERPHYAARECSSCKISHSAREGDIWAETSIFGLCWKYFALMEGKVYDITEWANCQKGALSHLQPNSHIVQYRIVRGGQQQQQNPQQEKERSFNREPPSEPSLDDFLDNLYSGQNPQNNQNSSRRRSRRN